MKRVFFYLFLALSIMSCSNKTPKVNIEIPEMKEGKIAIVYANPDQVSNTNQLTIYSSDFNDSKISITLDSINFEKDFIECALVITSHDESFFVNVPLPLEKGETIDVKFTNIEEYKNGGRINMSYSGSNHAEDFTIFWKKIQDQILEFRTLPIEELDLGYKNFVSTYKSYIEKYPQSGFPYMLLISQINNMQFDRTNPLIDYCNTICQHSKDNRWKEVFCNLLGEKRLAQETFTKLVFNAVDLNGKVYSERDIKGKLIFVDFWASWCKPCRDEMPHLKRLNNKYKAKGLTMVGISIDRTEKEWRDFLRTNPMPWLSLYGDGQIITKRYDFEYIPYNLIADSEGNIIAKNLHSEELDKFLEDYFSK